MARFDVLQHALNVGVVDKNKLHRVDLDRMRLASEIQTNLICDSIGGMYLRPGSGYLASVPAGAYARLLPFIAQQQATYVLELSANLMRVYDPSDVLITRVAVSNQIQNGAFASGTGWTLAATAGQVSAVTSNQLQLTARAHGGRAQAKQQVTCLNAGSEHALRIVVARGPVVFRCGSGDGLDDYISETTLLTGTHSLAFVPTGNFWIQFSNELAIMKIVTSIQVEGPGIMTLPTNWSTQSQLKKIRRAQSLDVMFCACTGLKQQRIERRGNGASAGRSWSVVDYDSNDGPFLVGPTSSAYLTPGATEGNTTLTSSIPFFKAAHVGALFRIYHEGQQVHTFLAGANQFTPTIQTSGINATNYNDRDFTYTISGTWAGTIRNSRSFDGDNVGFHDFRDKQASSAVDIVANVGPNINDDGENNAIAYYRLGFPAGKYTSGEAQIDTVYDGGGGFGICRVVGFTSSTSVNIEILQPFMGLHATQDWLEGSWSAQQGYPASCCIHQGRLSFQGSDKFWESVSDAYASFDISFVGDAAPIDRSIALSGRNEARWACSLSALMVGCDSRIGYARASSLDETVTDANLGIRSVGPVGAAAIDPAELGDNSLLFVEQSTQALYEVNYVPLKGAFLASEFSKLTRDVFLGGIEELVVQNRPDQRIHISCTNADAVTIIYEPDQKVVAFIPISTSVATDIIESQCVVPGNGVIQDRVYRSIKRVVNGATVRLVEKVALDSEAAPAAICKGGIDAHVVFGAGSAVITGLGHLEGRTVVAWADGAPVTDSTITDLSLDNIKYFTVTGGQITLPFVPVTGGCVGVQVVGRYKSARLAYGVGDATPVLGHLSVSSVGLLLADYCRSGIKYGGEFDNANHPLRSLPLLGPGNTQLPEVNAGVAPDQEPFPLDTKVGLDTRVCIEIKGPKVAKVLALVFGIDRK